ncbi:hypothetical protein BGZ99_006998 [Dissophora globulifera]|uniref:Myb-like domain-containing protein n=1 Tax=Dissophora globulifera TaxID=979702 RepID=A0A9P6RDD6_9FUNG|nr:hypothetical protein BGZ99_006998 [Dissophora globulifera]
MPMSRNSKASTDNDVAVTPRASLECSQVPVDYKSTGETTDINTTNSEKENIPPLNSTSDLHEEAQQQYQQPKVELVQQNKGDGKKRKWSRPTRVVKLEEQEDSTDDENSEVDRDDPEDDDYGVGPRKTYSKTETKSVKERSRLGHEPEISEYERERLENIRRNQEMLQILELPTTATRIQLAAGEDTSKTVKKELTSEAPSAIRIKRQYVKAVAPKIVQPVRTSRRLRGIDVAPLEIGENDMLDTKDGQTEQETSKSLRAADRGDSDENDEDEESAANLMSGDLYFDKETREKAIRVDGHYKGWINPEVMERHGFEKSAQEAWDANGGGAFSFSDPLGLNAGSGGSSSKSKYSKRPRHDAKMVSKALFKKNPNAFFYRHNEPGQEQWTGDWTEEERVIFLNVVKEHGCGDKWGLFASHIPHRVGYQCSNFYRQVVLPEGLVFDPNYEYTSRGKPIYCGKYNQRRD